MIWVSLFEKLKRAKAQLPYLPDTFRLIWAALRLRPAARRLLLVPDFPAPNPCHDPGRKPLDVRLSRAGRWQDRLLVTHRFTTAMQADIIHVMSAGRIIEAGSHAELLTCNGKYALSRRRQIRLMELDGEGAEIANS